MAPTVDARTDATLRTYVYRITCPSDESRVSTFDWNHVWPYPGLLDVAAMQAAAEHLLGKHDFSSFRAAGVFLSILLLSSVPTSSVATSISIPKKFTPVIHPGMLDIVQFSLRALCSLATY